jgi:hypothetical protein
MAPSTQGAACDRQRHLRRHGPRGRQGGHWLPPPASSATTRCWRSARTSSRSSASGSASDRPTPRGAAPRRRAARARPARLEACGHIPDCRLAETTSGELNEAPDNAILMSHPMSCARGSVTTPPWLSKHELRWTALTEARLAVLDHRLASRMARFREVTAATVGARHGPHRPAGAHAGDLAAQRVDRRRLSV